MLLEDNLEIIDKVKLMLQNLNMGERHNNGRNIKEVENIRDPAEFQLIKN